MQIIITLGCNNHHDLIIIFTSNSKKIGLTTWNEEWERKNDLVVLHWEQFEYKSLFSYRIKLKEQRRRHFFAFFVDLLYVYWIDLT